MIVLLNKKRWNINNEQVSDLKNLINILKIILQQKLVVEKRQSQNVKDMNISPISSNNDSLSDSLIKYNWDIEDIEEYNEDIKSYRRKIKSNSVSNKSKYCPNCQESPCMCSDPDPG
jgi:ribosomal protein S27AE